MLRAIMLCLLTASLLSCGTDQVTAPESDLDRPSFKRAKQPKIKLLASGQAIMRGSRTGRNQDFNPVGMAICLVHGTFVYDQTVPMPEGMTLGSGPVVGCDRAFPIGVHVVDYDINNAPEFVAFAAAITNGEDETLFRAGELVDPALLWGGQGGAGGGPESGFFFGNPKTGKVPGKKTDLTGYSIDFIRLTAHVIDFGRTLLGDGISERIRSDATAQWDFYGHKNR